MMAVEIPVSGGLVALVDDEDVELVSQYSWFKRDAGTVVYALTRGPRPERKHIRMHRLIMNAEPGQYVDHKNGNGLDNRRSNLRFATRVENSRNMRVQNASGYKGVHRASKLINRCWVASIRVDGRMLYLGAYPTPEEAARAYDAAAVTHFGEFAVTNFEDVDLSHPLKYIRTHCPKGHEYTPDNLVKDSVGRLNVCRECRRAHQREYYHKKRKFQPRTKITSTDALTGAGLER
jgi:hypothetical protein